MLNQSNASSPFSLSYAKKKKDPLSMGTLAMGDTPQKTQQAVATTTQSNPAAVPAKAAPSPAKTQYVQNVAQSPDYSGITSSLQGINDTIGKMREQQAPQTPQTNPYNAAMEKYLASLTQAPNSDYYDKYDSLLGKASSSQEQYAKRIQEIENMGAGAVAGHLSTGTDVVGSGNAAIASQSASSRLNALSNAQKAYLEGLGYQGDMLTNEFNRNQGVQEQTSNALKARADYEKSLLPQDEVQEIGGKLVKLNPETGAYEEVYSPTETPEAFELSEGQSRYEYDPATGSYREIASKGKTYAPGTGSKSGLPKLGVAQQEQIATMDTVVDLANQVLNMGESLPGVGGFGQGTIGGFTAAKFGFGGGGDEGQQTRNLVGNIQATIAKMRGGTSFTANEEALLKRYTPTVDDSDRVIQQKLRDLVSFVATLKKNTIGVATGESFGTKGLQNVQEVNGYTYAQGEDGNWYLQE